jgi:hypothetical protein
VSIIVRQYSPNDADAWDDFCCGALQATLLHTRRFLSYHGDHFRDASLILIEGDRWLGVLPAAYHSEDASLIVSHPGITYGGIIHQGGLRGQSMLDAMQLVVQHYANIGAKRFLYKAIPIIYHRIPSQDDLYALFRLDAQRIRCDLTSSIDIQSRYSLPERRRRSMKKAKASGMEIKIGKESITGIWRVLRENLARKHGVTPVHTEEEMLLLHERFPENIFFVAGVLEGEVQAGVVLFVSPNVLHAQYITSSEVGYKINALDLIFQYCISLAEEKKARYFDFGISNEENGQILNEGLYRFKSEFGGGGIVHEFFEIKLENRISERIK